MSPSSLETIYNINRARYCHPASATCKVWECNFISRYPRGVGLSFATDSKIYFAIFLLACGVTMKSRQNICIYFPTTYKKSWGFVFVTGFRPVAVVYLPELKMRWKPTTDWSAQHLVQYFVLQYSIEGHHCIILVIAEGKPVICI